MKKAIIIITAIAFSSCSITKGLKPGNGPHFEQREAIKKAKAEKAKGI